MHVLYVDGIAYAGDATNIETIQAANIQQIILLNLNSFFLCLFIKQFLHFYLLFRQKVPFSYTYKRKKRQNVTAAEKNDKNDKNGFKYFRQSVRWLSFIIKKCLSRPDHRCLLLDIYPYPDIMHF